jgi:FixJ family two-component response regulator
MSTVLLVDDDVGTLETCALILRTAGFDVVTAELGRTGVDLARSGSFEVILSDLCLPDISGLEVLTTLREAGVHSEFVIITGFASVPRAVEAMRLGAADFLEKPVFDEDVLHAVRRASDRWMQNHPLPQLASYAAIRWASMILPVVV